ncbi:MAG TPA: 3-hydroxyacyl-CoA dehydrogenase family protein [Candidatus Dormibacteraeota bacterium]|nr:3-hydroxyacyl-CoA dehydrogenase family protein [Candidatus Dormibacteraeota bacterium]
MAAEGRLLVLGAGTMGAQIAQQAALQGVEVRLVDVSRDQLERGVAQNRRLLEGRVAKGRMAAEDAEAALARVETSDDLPASAAACGWAIEAIVEQVEAKRQAFGELDRHLPEEAGIATNSSTIVSSRLASATRRPERVCNMHFFHPVLVMDVCEVVRNPQTSDATVADAVDWCRRMGRHAVVIEREIDGFVVNRILGAASREAFSLLTGGFASFADIDVAVKSGLNWPMGPFQLADFSGLDTVLNVRRDRAQRAGDPGDTATVALLEKLVGAGRLGRKAGRGFYDWSTTPPTPLPLPE